jgi:hypothetical protein
LIWFVVRGFVGNVFLGIVSASFSVKGLPMIGFLACVLVNCHVHCGGGVIFIAIIMISLSFRLLEMYAHVLVTIFLFFTLITAFLYLIDVATSPFV